LKNKLKLLAVGLGVLVLPFHVNAAEYSIIGSTSANVATYEIKYAPDATVTDGEKSVTFKIEKPNDGLKYEIKKSESLSGDCYNSDLSCTLTTIDNNALVDGTLLATLIITNDTLEDKTTNIAISGKANTKTEVSLPAKKAEAEKPKSNDATLSGINVSIGTMDQVFNKDISTYNVTGIKDTINSVRVTPECDNNCYWTLACPNGECTIKDGTSVNLQMGANQVSIFVESEDLSTKKTYVLNIYRGEIEVNSAYLSNINIKNSTLSPSFDSMTNDYTAIVGLDVDKLDIEAIAEDPNANIIIKGNENFVEGENTVTITVTSSDGQNKQVYTIIVTKEELEEEKEDDDKKAVKTNKVEKKKNNTLLIIILSIVGLGLIIAAYFIIFKIKKNKNKNNDKNNKNNNSGSSNSEQNNDVTDTNEDTKELTTKERIEEITKEIELPNIDDEPKQDIDEALDDLMKTKKLELGDLDI